MATTNKYIPGTGPCDAKLMIVGEAPGEEEDELGQTLVGPTGRLTQEMVEEAGLGWSQVYRTNVFKYRPPENDIKRLEETGHTLDECVPQLWNEINSIQPNAILALGNLALTTLTGKKKIRTYRGSILESVQGYPKVIPTIHPAWLFKQKEGEGTNWSDKVIIQLDINRAVEQSKFKDFRLPQRILQIAHNSGELWAYLNLYENQRRPNGKLRVSVDVEVHNGIITCVGLAFNKDHAISVPVINVDYARDPLNIPTRDLAAMLFMLAEFLERDDIEVIGQNLKFDDQKLRTQLGIRIKHVIGDTAYLANVLHAEFSKKLEHLTSIYTEEPYYKDEYRNFDPKRDSFNRVMTYNGKDCCVTDEAFDRMMIDAEERGLTEFFNCHMMPLHEFYMDIERVGIPIDFDKRNEIYRYYMDQEYAGNQRLSELLGRKFNIRSNPQVREAIEVDLDLPARASYSEDDIVILLANKAVKTDKQREFLDGLLKQRRLSRLISTTIEAETDYDDRMRTTYLPYSTETGRSSTTNLDAPTRQDKIGTTFHTIPKHGLGNDIRKYYVADKGCVMLACDCSQAEPRIVARLSNDKWLEQLFADHKDVHRYTAQLVFDLPDEVRDKIAKDSPERFIGKKVRNAGAYDMGPLTMKNDVNSESRRLGVNITLQFEQAKLLLSKFHKRSPNIKAVYHAEIQAELEKSRSLRNPYGRERMFFDRWGDSLFREAYATIPQGTVIDKVRLAGRNIKKRIPGIKIFIEWHDALYFMVEEMLAKEYKEIIKEEFETLVPFDRCSIPREPLLIPAEFEIGYNLYDMEKF